MLKLLPLNGLILIQAEIILDHETRTLSITNGRSEVCDPGDSIEEYQIGDVTIPSAGKVSRGRGRGSKTATTTSSRGRGSRGGRKSRGAPAGNKVNSVCNSTDFYLQTEV